MQGMFSRRTQDRDEIQTPDPRDSNPRPHNYAIYHLKWWRDYQDANLKRPSWYKTPNQALYTVCFPYTEVTNHWIQSWLGFRHRKKYHKQGHLLSWILSLGLLYQRAKTSNATAADFLAMVVFILSVRLSVYWHVCTERQHGDRTGNIIPRACRFYYIVRDCKSQTLLHAYQILLNWFLSTG